MNAHRATAQPAHLLDGLDVTGVKTADGQLDQFALLLRRLVESIAVAKPVMTIDEFCEDHCITRAHYYALKKQGKGPREMALGRRKLITQEAAAEWRKRMEKETLSDQTSLANS